jgi:hypothetical protein
MAQNSTGEPKNPQGLALAVLILKVVIDTLKSVYEQMD